jgi:hypothetical protein
MLHVNENEERDNDSAALVYGPEAAAAPASGAMAAATPAEAAPANASPVSHYRGSS